MSHVNMFLFTNGVVSHAAEAPLVTTLLENHAGAYTTTRTHKNGLEILFWERHLQRLSNSFNLLLKSNPKFLFDNFETNKVPILELSSRPTMWDPVIQLLVHDSMKKVVPFVSKELKIGEEYAITTLLSGNSEKLCCLEGNFDEKRVSEILDVYVHIGGYVPAALGVRVNEAHLAVVGRGRNLANAKYSEWVRLRKTLEKLRPPCVTELLLSNDDDHILEGCLTNFFVVRQKGKGEGSDVTHQNGVSLSSFVEVQTAPLSDAVLPGVIRQVIRDICLNIGIPFREVAPSWSDRELWMEAFITNSLRLLQPVKTIQAPSTWELAESKTWKEIMWMEKRFKDVPGRITSIIQREILEKAGVEAFPILSFEDH